MNGNNVAKHDYSNNRGSRIIIRSDNNSSRSARLLKLHFEKLCAGLYYARMVRRQGFTNRPSRAGTRSWKALTANRIYPSSSVLRHLYSGFPGSPNTSSLKCTQLTKWEFQQSATPLIMQKILARTLILFSWD